MIAFNCYMEKGTSDEKRKALLNIYWFLLAVFAVLSAVNLFAISKDSVKAAAIVNLVLMIVIPVVFVLGYIDFRNFSPLSNKKEILYVATEIVAFWITLVHFNVQNYTFLSDYTTVSTYIPWVSAIAALYLANAFTCLLLTFLNFHSHTRHVRYFYTSAVSSIVACIFLTAFNYDTKVTLFWAPLRLIGIKTPFIEDIGMTILALRVVIEYGIFLAHSRHEKKKNLLPAGEETEFKPGIVKPAIIAVTFMLIHLVVLPFIEAFGSLYPEKQHSVFIAYETVDGITVAALLILGIIIAAGKKKSAKYGEVYLRMGLASILFAVVYGIMDFIPFGSLLYPDNEIQAINASNIFHSSVKIVGLAAYTLYVACNKKLNATLKLIDADHEERMSSENYSI